MDFTKIEESADSADNQHFANGADDKGDEEMTSDQDADFDLASGTNEPEEDDNEEEEEDSDEGHEAEVVAEINLLQEELSHNPLDYDKHVALITKIRSIGELEVLREARERMNQLFPLSPELWIEWIYDENEIASTNEQKTHITELYDRAVADYLSSSVWSNYIQHLSEMNETNLINDEDFRRVLERALNSAGCCVNGGVLFWRYYRLFEVNLLSAHTELTPDNTEQVNQCIKNIFDLYQRQFSIPLLEMEQDYSQFEEWLEDIKERYVIDLKEQKKQEFALMKNDYEKSIKTLSKLKEFEDNILNSEAPHYEQYLNYIEFELKTGQLARTQSLFERAITENCLQSDLWLKYLKYCDEKFVVEELLLPLYDRAIRNCPWVADIWVQYVQACERLAQNEDPEKLNDKVWLILEQALKNQFSTEDDVKKLWLAYLNFLRRKACKTNAWSDEQQVITIRETFESVITSMEEMSGVDYCYDLYRYLALIEAKYCKNVEKSRDILKDLTNRSPNLKRKASFWIDFATIELQYGQAEEYRKVLHKGLIMCSDYPEVIGEALLKFEQEEGESVEQYANSIAKYEAAIKKINEKRTKEEEKLKAQEEEKPQQGRPLKRKAENVDASKSAKSTKGPTESKKKKFDNTATNHGVTVQTDDSKREQTVFISNLSFDLDEEAIRQAFVQFGPISDVRLVRSYKGESKGFAYVEFESVTSARKSLMHDRMRIKGRPVYINEMDKRNKFSFSSNQEKSKLFVKNIPFEMTETDLKEKVFADFADSIVNIRVVTYRSGHSKGWAYVEMKSEALAQKAVQEKNNFLLGDKQLFVAISDPSASRNTVKPSLANKASSSKISTSSTFMLPHSLMAKSYPPKMKMQLDPSTSDTKPPPLPTSDSEQSEAKKLSNDQFRSMFLK